MGEKLTITVPASSANLGPGFDSIGLAIDRYLTLEVYEADAWQFTSSSEHLEGIPTGKDNMVYKVARALAATKKKVLPPCHVHMSSDIPLARGLGSSAAAIIAAIELGDQLGDLELTKEEKLRFASVIEGHPDNVGACLYGGLTVGMHTDCKTRVVAQQVPEVDLVLMIPSDELLTSKARQVLPEQLKYQDAVQAGACGNVLVAALMTQNWPLVGEMMGDDRYHHPYRGELIPGLSHALHDVKDYGVYGAALSGAGPTVLCLAPLGRGEDISASLQADYPDYYVVSAKPAIDGSLISYENKSVASL
ncbi:homoserine kinase [Geomicrobium halophilum]|uniref:Homoserine kinase n=1 Tax=Geomicrobium halophilum TaxID=549000 RepID=A0A841PZM1_9BACL|nr:homoserine kinase [Geomicrobium halophilum]MBB6450202.1 homoserine kinase [Geomicrobium halophilum]